MVRTGRRFSIAHLALVVPWIALVIDAGQPISDNSFLWHIRAGELQIRASEVLTADPFSFTMGGSEWRTQSWLVELLYGWAESISNGLGFVPLMLLVVTTITFIGIGLVGYKYSRSVPATTFILILSTLALISFLAPRPVVFSFLLMILVILAWASPRTRWTLPFLLWVWASVHASFLIGLAFISLTILMERDWKALRFVIPAGLTTLFTAHGFGVVEFLISFGDNRDALRYLSEWRKPELLSVVFLPFVGGLIFVVFGAFRRLIGPQHLWLLLPFTFLAMTSVRAIPPAWLAIVPLVALALGGIEIGLRRGLRARLAVVFVLVVATLPFLLVGNGGIDEERFPVEAIGELRDLRTFHDDRAGGFLIWAEGPELQVYIDDRAELYGPRIEEFVQVTRGVTDWEDVFQRDHIEQALLLSGEPLVGELEESGWTVSYRDDVYTILLP